MVRVIEAHYESYVCPMVIAGKTTDGSTLYARIRWGRLSVRIDPRPDPPHGGAAGKWILDAQVGDGEYTGGISYEELREITRDHIEWPDREPD
jgi:hypothetical protein